MKVYRRNFWLREPGKDDLPAMWYDPKHQATAGAVAKVQHKFKHEEKLWAAGRPWSRRGWFFWVLWAGIITGAIFTENPWAIVAFGLGATLLYIWTLLAARLIVRRDRNVLIKEVIDSIHGPFMVYGDTAWAALNEQLEAEHGRTLATIIRTAWESTAATIANFLATTRKDREVLTNPPKATASDDLDKRHQNISKHAATAAAQMMRLLPQDSRR